MVKKKGGRDMKGSKNPFYGKHHSKKSIEKLKSHPNWINRGNSSLKGTHIQTNTGRTHIKKGEHISLNTEFKKGHKSWNKGKSYKPGIPRHKYDDDFKEKISKAQKGRTTSDFTKRKMRESAIKYVEEKKLNGCPLTPNIGRYEKSVLNNLEKCFNYQILRQYKVAGYFLDGYCPMMNLAIEVDESHHNNIKQLNADIVREENIKALLNCNFLRIKIGDDNNGAY